MTSPQTFPVTRELVDEIDMILPKLKYSLTLEKILDWLGGFEENDRMHALEMLFFMEYVTCEEMQLRFDQLLHDIFSNHVPREIPVLFLPLGKAGKSGDLMKYFVRKTRSYGKYSQRIEWLYQKPNKSIRENSALVLLDDFIGSGQTIIDEYQRFNIDSWLSDNPKITIKIVLALIAQNEGQKRIEDKLRGFKVIAQNRQKAFSEAKSPFDIRYNRNSVKETAIKYGKRLPVNMYGKLAEVGFENSEALVAFPYGCPNNTLPIMWNTYGGWKAPYPRFIGARMDSSRKFKKKIAYWIGIMHRLKIYLESDIVVEAQKKRRKYSGKKYFSLFTYLKLKSDGYENPLICQILGITTAELAEIWKFGIIKRYLDENGEITDFGKEYYLKLTHEISKNPLQKITANDLQVMAPEEYVKPKTPGKKEYG